MITSYYLASINNLKTELANVFGNHVADGRLIHEIHLLFLQFQSHKNDPVTPRDLNTHFLPRGPDVRLKWTKLNRYVLHSLQNHGRFAGSRHVFCCDL